MTSAIAGAVVPAPSNGPRTDSMADSVMILLVLTVVQRAVGFVRSVLFVRWLSPDELGQWDMAYGFLTLAAPLAVLGLPGSFGRYVEFYRQRGQLRSFLRRTSAAAALLTCAAVAGVVWRRDDVAQFVFGTAGYERLAVAAALALAGFVALNFLTSLFTALRMFRVACVMQFANGVLFAALSIPLLAYWRVDSVSVVAAFGAASATSALGALPWLRSAWTTLPPETERPPQRALWGKILPFALWLWTTNWIGNLFDVVDRYMLIHFSGLDADAALALVGQYHGSRVIPVLFLAVADMLATMALPHLTEDWESGRREAVNDRLNLFLKVLGFGLVAASVGVLAFAPALFDVAFRGKYGLGLSVLPWTLTYCVWNALAGVAHNYLWCAEKARLVTLTLAVGLAVNVAINLALVPTFGLHGAVLGTTVANAAALTLISALARPLGLRLHSGAIVLMAAPLLLPLGPWIAGGALVIVAVAAGSGSWILEPKEKQELTQVASAYVDRLRRLVPKRGAAGA